MRKKIGIFAMAFLLAVSIAGCGNSKVANKNNKDADKKSATEEQKEGEEEENKYSPIIAEDVEIKDSEYPYQIKVNRALNCVTVYTLDDEDEYTIPVRALICSTGGESTPTGTFQLGDYVEWEMLPDGDFGRYVTRIVDSVVFRSVSYTARSEDALDVDAYNHLGDKVDDSAIVLGEADAQWIAENCPQGTCVEIYDDEDEAGPLGKPWARLISGEITWDPTDRSKENAWYVPVSFFGIADKTITVGETPNLLEGITAKDKYGTDLTASIKVYGEVDVNEAGEYKISYSCENSDGDKREVETTVTVKEGDNSDNSNENKTQEPSAQQENTADKSEEVQVQEKTQKPVATSTPLPTENTTVQADNSADSTVVTTVTTTQQEDNEPPIMVLTANTANVLSIKTEYLRERVYVSDKVSGVDDVYISVCRIPDDGSYVVIYEAFDNAGNSSCVSETVYLQ